MNVVKKEISPIQHELEIEIPWDEVEKRIPDAVREFQAVAEIKGFRKGKAPPKVVRAHTGEKRVLQAAAERAASDAFSQAGKDLEKKPIAPPRLDLGDIKEGEPLTLTAKSGSLSSLMTR